MKRPTKQPPPSRRADDSDRMTKSGRLNVAELKKALKAAQEKGESKHKP
ncbi:MAG: hypothetical protein ACM4AI_06350 [Acidobacteriota bacterium]